MNWLYHYYVTYKKEMPKDLCPPDYIYEPKTKGCRPEFPLIFAIKHGDWAAYDGLLEAIKDGRTGNDPNFSLNAKDSTGDTALHYAAYLVRRYGQGTYDMLLNAGADTKIKNDAGWTAPNILERLSSPR